MATGSLAGTPYQWLRTIRSTQQGAYNTCEECGRVRSVKSVHALWCLCATLNQNTFNYVTLYIIVSLGASKRSHYIVYWESFNFSFSFRYLESNGLTYVNRLMFAGPTQLISLWVGVSGWGYPLLKFVMIRIYFVCRHLYANEITRISDGAFFRLNKLQKLWGHS